ncbi:G-protein coupled receptor GRL101-like [Lineus longissimus]|uniref:G-protein coupled receptor GRL101-like n=1 Tax=Lineus longissimus TaxID=88925 RepID=UPI00315DF116
MLVKDGERIFLSNGTTIYINLTTCHRYRTPINDGPLSHFGFNASVYLSECPGCSVQSECQGTTVCDTSCGHILSLNFPSPYPKNSKCTWEITVQVGRYVALEFVVFDVFEETSTVCHVDYLEMFDFDHTGDKRMSIGRFCNSHIPPKLTLSSWNKLGLELMTNFKDERPGFHAKYKSLTYAFSTEKNTTVNNCQLNWFNYGPSCYFINQTEGAYVTWLKARDLCIISGGYLVSINDQKEMEFIHYTLTTLTKQLDNRFYIGLSDREREGSWTWEDGSPVTFSAWSVSGEFAQPDGSQTEDCTMILLNNIYSFNQWHDIPCSYNKVNQYICEKPAYGTKAKNATSVVDERQAYFKPGCPYPWFRCSRGECISSDHVCDGKKDCFDGSDEEACVPPCPETSFHCANGRCISLTLFCDFEDHCGDRSDEIHCVPRKCQAEEYMCSNGECIPSRNRCDLVRDCVDGTDEENCQTCQKDVAYQCYDGTCIPKSTRCDSRIDCPGSFNEDESLGCATETRQTCADWLRDGHVTNGSRVINPGSLGAFEVECQIHSDHGHVVTVVHHNTAVRTSVHGYEEYLSYIRNVTYYDVTMQQITALKSLSTHCDQFMKLECFASSAVKNLNGWYDIKGELNLYNAGNKMYPKCKCWLDKACEDDRELCWCMNKLDGFEWYADEGYLTNTDRLPITAFTLQDTGDQNEYVYHTVGPLRCYQALEPSVQKFKCKNGQPISQKERCKAHNDQHGNDIGCRDRSHLENCGDAVCQEGYIKCPGSYCIPVGSLCDGTWDCPMGEDEISCQSDQQAKCPGMYKCKSKWNCVQWERVCNGERDCPEGDDERHCYLSCPDKCSCNLLTYRCKSVGLTSLPANISANARKLDLSRNAIKLDSGVIFEFWWLGELILSENALTHLLPNLFVNLKNLYLLDLSHNNLKSLKPGTFAGLGNLVRLVLSGNHQLGTMYPDTFTGLDRLPVLDLSEFKLLALENHFFRGLHSLENLTLSNNNIARIEANAFAGLGNLTRLNMSGNTIETFSITIFDNLNLDFLQTDDFSFCCLVHDRLSEEHCLPPRDEISSCEDLMRDDLLRATLWVLGCCAFFGNGFVFIWRFFNKEGNAIHGLFVQHLALSDFLMGLYLLALGAADIHFRGRYIEHANSWRRSWMCNALGAIATIASETSVFMLCSITTDRLVSIAFPFGGKRLNKKRAYIVLCVVWTSAVLIACVPLLPIGYFRGQFYSRAGVCVSLHITRETPPGWEYSVAIFHGLNFAAFLYIAFAYGSMFIVIRETGSAAGAKEKQAEIAAAKKMILVVLTDFLCWVPINIMGFIALAGGNIPGEVYAWTVVLLLPINSAINPILYTISSMNVKKRRKTLQRARTALVKETTLNSAAEFNQKLNNVSGVMVECCNSGDQVTLGRLLNSSMLSMRNILHALREVTRTLVKLHEMSLCLGALDMDDVLVRLSGTDSPPNVWIVAKPRPAQNEFQFATDVDELRKVIVKILRIRASA